MDNVFITKIFIIVLVLLSTAFHEMAHAFVATWLGDSTPARYGRLTLNPIPHLQPVMTAIVLPVLMFLSGNGLMILASTPINPASFRHPLRDRALVSIAGPLTNILCAATMAGALWIPGVAVPGSISTVALEWSVYMNLVLAVFNMMPIPPLDGYWILRTVLPFSVRRQTDQLASSQFSFLIVIVLGSYLMKYCHEPIAAILAVILP